MDKDLVVNITALLDEGFQIIMKYGEATQGGNPVKIFINKNKVGRYYHNGEWKLHGTKSEIKLADDILKWDTHEHFGKYVSDNSELLADTYECFFYIDDEPEKLYLSISGYGEWDEEEFTTSGAMEIITEED